METVWSRSDQTVSKPLPQDLDGELGRAAALDELDGAMEVDVVAAGELRRRLRRVAGAFELVCAPVLDLVELPTRMSCRRRHLALAPSFGRTVEPVLPMPGDPQI